MAETELNFNKTRRKIKKVRKIIKDKKDKAVANARRAFLLFWADIVWYVHFAVVFAAIGLFFIPLSIMPNRIEIQFFFLWGILALQLVFGMIYFPKTKKFYFVCPLTAIEKHLVKRHPHRHVGESCVADFCVEKLGLPKWMGTIAVIICLAISTIQYFKLI